MEDDGDAVAGAGRCRFQRRPRRQSRRL